MKPARPHYVLVLSIGILACKSGLDTSDPTTSNEVTSTTVVLENSAAQSATNRKRRKVLVGGCDSNCADYKAAFHNYLMAASRGEDGIHTIAYLETSEMTYNHQSLGSGWVELWRNDDLEKRQSEIANFAREAHLWVNKVPSDTLLVSFQNSITFSEDDGPGFLAYYKPPEGALTAENMNEWRYRIQKRGWEWLISEIQSVEPP